MVALVDYARDLRFSKHFTGYDGSFRAMLLNRLSYVVMESAIGMGIYFM